MEGEGIMTYPLGMYKGQFKGGLMNGKGISTSPQGDKHDGYWLDGVAEGHGIYTRTNGNVYDGEFKAGKMEGKGVETAPTGDKFVGTWVNGRRTQGYFISKEGEVLPYGHWEGDEFVINEPK